MHNKSVDVRQYVIGHEHFNKSLTLDVENRLISYLHSVPNVDLVMNRRANPQDDYYTADEFDRIFSQVWMQLHRKDPILFPSEGLIRDSALFKASPFRKLNDEQKEAEFQIIEAINTVFNIQNMPTYISNSTEQIPLLADEKTEYKNNNENETENLKTPYLILVQGMAGTGKQGMAGTGKTVLLSHLFEQVCNDLKIIGPMNANEGSEPYNNESKVERKKSYVIVNHNEQENVYNQIALKLGLQKKQGDIVVNATQFINRFSNRKWSEKRNNFSGQAIPDQPNGKADVVLIDEAHLLRTQGNRAYGGSNQLEDILQRTKLAIVVFDPEQILHSSQQWSEEDLDFLQPSVDDSLQNTESTTQVTFKSQTLHGKQYKVARIRLNQQMRVQASEATCKWLDDFTSLGIISRLNGLTPSLKVSGDMVDSKSFSIHIFDSPVELYTAIRKRSEDSKTKQDGKSLSRLIATYDWDYSENKRNDKNPSGYWNVELHKDKEGRWVSGLAEEDSEAVTSESVFCQPWNYQLYPEHGQKRADSKSEAWAERDFTIAEVGSTYTIQGFDLNFAGVIIGPSVVYRDGKVQFRPHESKDATAIQGRRDLKIDPCENLKHQLNVLLKRGVHGLYLFAVDRQLQQKLKEVIYNN